MVNQQMPSQKRSVRKGFWIKLAALAVVIIPVVAWANVLVPGVTPGHTGVTVTEPAALTLLGGSLISLSFLIRRFKS
jgi:hypothetical protein